uniref:Sema domain-containing protein n=1 Tax=Tetranychus urticae TaxID=32264 RepID=A0A158P4V7_TETUR
MFIHLLIWTFQFCLLIPKSYSFKTPKHDSLFYYRSRDSVFLTNPFNHTTFYGIYVAGQTITVDIPTSVVNVSDILNWKLVNTNEKRLMFVHKKKPQILIDRQRTKQMNYSGELSDSIIAFGDNEALHVPTISNPSLTKPAHKWNYLELLYFDDKNEEVSVIQSLPWLKDDWKFIKEWKMMDYIHFDDKLYLLIFRSISKAKSKSVTQEISIIRLCLNKGSELISSAVEIHFTDEAFESKKIIDLFFVFLSKPFYNETNPYQVHTITLQPPSNTKAYHIYYIDNFVSKFIETAKKCASGSSNITLLRQHLRFQVGKCRKTLYKSCLTKGNIVPSRNVSLVAAVVFEQPHHTHVNFYAPYKIEIVTLPYPYDLTRILIHVKPLTHSVICEYFVGYAGSPKCDFPYLNSSISSYDISEFDKADFHTNKLPYGAVYVFKETNKILFIPIEVCSRLKTCTQCIMYGLYSGCIWTNSICVSDDQPKNKATLTVDHCFKIINIAPLVFRPSSRTRLTIELDKPLIRASSEYLVIQAGDNLCTNIKRNEVFINCSMRLTKAGKFNINVSLRNDKYADTSILSALSNDKVHIFASDSDYTLIIISVTFSCLIINSFLLIFYYIRKSKRKSNKEHLTRIKKVSPSRKVKQFVGTHSDKKFIKFFVAKKKSGMSAITRVRAPIVSSTMDSLDDSTITNKPSSEKDSLRITMRSEPSRMYPQKKLLSSKRK